MRYFTIVYAGLFPQFLNEKIIIIVPRRKEHDHGRLDIIIVF